MDQQGARLMAGSADEMQAKSRASRYTMFAAGRGGKELA